MMHTFKSKNGTTTKNLSALKACREKWKNCSNWQDQEIKLCPVTDCALFIYRFGKNPERKGRCNNPNPFGKARSAQNKT